MQICSLFGSNSKKIFIMRICRRCSARAQFRLIFCGTSHDSSVCASSELYFSRCVQFFEAVFFFGGNDNDVLRVICARKMKRDIGLKIRFV